MKDGSFHDVYPKEATIRLERLTGRLVLMIDGVISLTLSPEQEAQFWKQAAKLLDEKAAKIMVHSSIA